MALTLKSQEEIKKEELSSKPVVNPRAQVKQNKVARNLQRLAAQLPSEDKQRPGASYLSSDTISELALLESSDTFHIVAKIFGIAIEPSKDRKGDYIIYPTSLRKLPIVSEVLIEDAFALLQLSLENIGEDGKISGQLLIDEASKIPEQEEDEKLKADLKKFIQNNIRSALQHTASKNVSYWVLPLLDTHTNLFEQLKEKHNVAFSSDRTGLLIHDKLARFNSKILKNVEAQLYKLYNRAIEGKSLPQTEEEIHAFVHDKPSDPILYGHKEAPKPKYFIGRFDTKDLRVDQKNELAGKQSVTKEYQHFAVISEIYPNLIIEKIDKKEDDSFTIFSENESNKKDQQDTLIVIDTFEKIKTFSVGSRDKDKKKQLTPDVFRLMLERNRDNEAEFFNLLSILNTAKERYAFTNAILGKFDPTAETANARKKKLAASTSAGKLTTKDFWNRIGISYKGVPAGDETQKTARDVFLASSSRHAKKLLAFAAFTQESFEILLRGNRKNNQEIFLNGPVKHRDSAITFLRIGEMAIDLLEKETQKVVLANPNDYGVISPPTLSTKEAGVLDFIKKVSTLLKPPEQDDKNKNELPPEYMALGGVVESFKKYRLTVKDLPHKNGFNANGLLKACKSFDSALEAISKNTKKEKQRAKRNNSEKTPELLLEEQKQNLIIDKTTAIRGILKIKIGQAQQKIDKKKSHVAKQSQTAESVFSEEEQKNITAAAQKSAESRKSPIFYGDFDTLQTSVYSLVGKATLSKTQLPKILDMFYVAPKALKQIKAEKSELEQEKTFSPTEPQRQVLDHVISNSYEMAGLFNSKNINYLQITVVGCSFKQPAKELLSSEDLLETVKKRNTAQNREETNNILAPYVANESKNPNPNYISSSNPLKGFTMVVPLHNDLTINFKKANFHYSSAQPNPGTRGITPNRWEEEFSKEQRNFEIGTFQNIVWANSQNPELQDPEKPLSAHNTMLGLHDILERCATEYVREEKLPIPVRVNIKTPSLVGATKDKSSFHQSKVKGVKEEAIEYYINASDLTDVDLKGDGNINYRVEIGLPDDFNGSTEPLNVNKLLANAMLFNHVKYIRKVFTEEHGPLLAKVFNATERTNSLPMTLLAHK